jgi:5-formyltetrahydrofolate cyclo-ligase
VQAKKDLRREMRAKRKEFVASLPNSVRSLILNRPPAAVAEHLTGLGTIGLYYPVGEEAPSLGWARWLHENGWQVALPRFAGPDAPMAFHVWDNPWDEASLEPGLSGIPQPRGEAIRVEPDALIIPLVAFTADGHRLGQGAGHYDCWLAEHGPVSTIGLAWDVQRVEAMPLEPHDQRLTAVVTPTRIYWSEA